MNSIVAAKVTIRGTRPFWQHTFSPDVLALTRHERSGTPGNDPDEWRRTCAVTREGQLFFYGSYVFSCLKNAAAFTKSGHFSIQTSVAATLQVVTRVILLDRYLPGFPNGSICDLRKVPAPTRAETEAVYLDVRGVVNPVTRARNVRYRLAASPGWSAKFMISWDKTVVSRPEMHAVLIDAGRLVGLGNGRNLGMGRFEVVEMTTSE